MKVRNLWLTLLLSVIMLLCVFAGTASSHKNPMTLTDEWSDYFWPHEANEYRSDSLER